MLKRTPLLILTLFTVVAVKAQYISLQAGVAVPSGAFGNSVYTNPEDGFAKSGATVSLFTNYLIGKRLGICADIRYASFGFDHETLSEQANNQAPPLTQVAATSEKKYTASSAMAGISYTLGSGNFTFEGRFMTGFLTLRTPTLTYATTYNGQSYNKTFESQNDLSLAFGYGVGVKYALPKDLYVLVNIDNTIATMEFPKNGYQSSTGETVSKPYQAYLICAGLGYKLQ